MIDLIEAWEIEVAFRRRGGPKKASDNRVAAEVTRDAVQATVQRGNISISTFANALRQYYTPETMNSLMYSNLYPWLNRPR